VPEIGNSGVWVEIKRRGEETRGDSLVVLMMMIEEKVKNRIRGAVVGDVCGRGTGGVVFLNNSDAYVE
jgi:microcompartment protein CcmK/EutM